MALLLGLAMVVVGVNWLSGGDARESGQAAVPPAPSSWATVSPIAGLSISPGQAVISSSPVAAPSPTVAPSPTATPRPLAACRPTCLIRLAATGAESWDAWLARGLRPSYADGGYLWAAAPPDVIAALQDERRPLTIVAEEVDTLPLYAVRLPVGGASSGLVEQVGQVIDRVDNRLIVRARVLPPPIDALVAAGVWIEKLPPAAARPGEPDEQPRLGDSSILGSLVSTDELAVTISALQDIGAAAGAPNSRAYVAPGNVAAAEYIFGRLAEAGLEVRYEDFVTDNGRLATNVVGELPGRDPNRVFLVVAHYDSHSENGEAPGADDNASGVAAMIELARLLARYDLPHPIRFVALTAEESGFQGAESFAAGAAAAGVAYTAAFNLDAIGAPIRDHELVLNADADSAWLLDAVAAANDAYGLEQDLVARQNPAIVSDDTVLRRWGIPAVLITRALVGENPVHHTPEDTLVNLDLHGVEEATRLTLLTLADLLGDA